VQTSAAAPLCCKYKFVWFNTHTHTQTHIVLYSLPLLYIIYYILHIYTYITFCVANTSLFSQIPCFLSWQFFHNCLTLQHRGAADEVCKHVGEAAGAAVGVVGGLSLSPPPPFPLQSLTPSLTPSLSPSPPLSRERCLSSTSSPTSTMRSHHHTQCHMSVTSSYTVSHECHIIVSLSLPLSLSPSLFHRYNI
jgi:hypothetical protein